jgi:hypothetical protein
MRRYAVTVITERVKLFLIKIEIEYCGMSAESQNCKTSRQPLLGNSSANTWPPAFEDVSPRAQDRPLLEDITQQCSEDRDWEHYCVCVIVICKYSQELFKSPTNPITNPNPVYSDLSRDNIYEADWTKMKCLRISMLKSFRKGLTRMQWKQKFKIATDFMECVGLDRLGIQLR